MAQKTEVTFEIEGQADVLSRFVVLGRLQEEAVQQMIRRWVERAVHIAQGYAPVDTGFLRDHIRGEVEHLAGLIISEAPYSIYQEYGTRYQPGTPYLRPTLERIKEPFYRDLQGALKAVH